MEQRRQALLRCWWKKKSHYPLGATLHTEPWLFALTHITKSSASCVPSAPLPSRVKICLWEPFASGCSVSGEIGINASAWGRCPLYRIWDLTSFRWADGGRCSKEGFRDSRKVREAKHKIRRRAKKGEEEVLPSFASTITQLFSFSGRYALRWKRFCARSKWFRADWGSLQEVTVRCLLRRRRKSGRWSQDRLGTGLP